jgi:hypothetical protein
MKFTDQSRDAIELPLTQPIVIRLTEDLGKLPAGLSYHLPYELTLFLVRQRLADVIGDLTIVADVTVSEDDLENILETSYVPVSGVIESISASNDPLFNDQQAAVQLGVSPATLRSWRCRGIGPNFVKMGAGKKSPVRYSSRDIEQFITQCRQVPPVRAAQENY